LSREWATIYGLLLILFCGQNIVTKIEEEEEEKKKHGGSVDASKEIRL
jgi:hypothetical protein